MATLTFRPAFYTPIHQESNLPDFKQAITDTIQALGTGICKARDGQVIGRNPSRQQLKSDTLRTKVQTVEVALSRLRAKFDEMIKSGLLIHCQCSDPTCPVYFFKPYDAADELERLRLDVLTAFRDAYATGKRGHIVEALYLKVGRGASRQTFNFWMYGETKNLKIGSGLRVGEDGVSFNHHFLPSQGDSTFGFLAGEYTIESYARILNRHAPVRLSTVKLSLSAELANASHDRTKGVLFTWSPDTKLYYGNVSEPPPGEGRSRSVSGAGHGKLPWA